MSEKEIFLFKHQNYVTGSGDKYRSELHVILKFYIIVNEIANIENIVA